MIVSIHQPDYIPWLGYFYKMAHSDVFVYLDDAQFSNEAGQNFNWIKTSQGKYQMHIPVEYHFKDLINTVRTKDELKWKQKHLRTIEMNYKRGKFFDEIYPGYKEIFERPYNNISEFNIAINNYIADGFGLHPKFIVNSSLDIKTFREQRIIDICKILGADEYLSGNGARAYQTEQHFADAGLKLAYLDYKPIEYEQLWHEFLPCMSVLDYIFNCGFDWQQVEDKVRSLNS